jgi:NADH-quinone oxidoreductase subunit G
VLLNAEPELDCYDPALAMAAMRAAEFVVALSPYQHAAVDYAHVMLPIGPFTETSGTFVNTEGRPQSFRGVVNPLAETRPGWKVLRVLGTMLGVEGFGYTSSEQVRDEALAAGELSARLNNRLNDDGVDGARMQPALLERIGEVPAYHADAIVRRSPPLLATHEGRLPVASMSSETLTRLGLRAGGAVLLRQGQGEATLPVAADERIPPNCVRVPAGHPQTSALGSMFGPIEAQPVALDERKAG